MKKTLSILLFFGFLSCASKKDKIEKSTDMVFLGGIIEDYMLECTDANHLEVHTKAKFNPTDSTLTFYTGESQSDFFQKWQIPLSGVNTDLIDESLDSFHRKLKISGIAQDSVIYYSNRKDSVFKPIQSFNIYLYNWCDDKKQEHFISAVKRITALTNLE